MAYISHQTGNPLNDYFGFASECSAQPLNSLELIGMKIPSSFPKAFLERYEVVFGPDVFKDVINGFDAKRHTWFRINTLKGSVQDAFNLLDEEKVPYHRSELFSDAGWVEFSDRDLLLASTAVRTQLVYIQGFASQLPVRFLDITPGLKVLDLAAAPGSKTIQIAGLSHPEDEIAAVEVVRKRKFKLQDNLSMHGAGHIRVFLQDGTNVWKYRPEHFDRVLLDAPCSSEGRFQLSDEHSFGFWNASKVKEMVRKQRRLLFSAVHALKPGGTLVYSTCALSPEENEGAVDYVLNSFGDCLEVQPIALDLAERMQPIGMWRKKEYHSAVQHACRLMPSEHMEGFFVCKFKKIATSNPPLKFSR